MSLLSIVELISFPLFDHSSRLIIPLIHPNIALVIYSPQKIVQNPSPNFKYHIKSWRFTFLSVFDFLEVSIPSPTTWTDFFGIRCQAPLAAKDLNQQTAWVPREVPEGTLQFFTGTKHLRYILGIHGYVHMLYIYIYTHYIYIYT